MITVERIAEICRELNKMYCESIGDNSQKSWPETSPAIKASTISGVMKIKSGEVTKPSDSHTSWYNFKKEEGWVFGEIKDEEKKTHPCMVHYNDLPIEQKLKDELFFNTTTTLLRLNREQ